MLVGNYLHATVVAVGPVFWLGVCMYFYFSIRGRHAGRLLYYTFNDRRPVKNEKLIRSRFNLNAARFNNES